MITDLSIIDDAQDYSQYLERLETPSLVVSPDDVREEVLDLFENGGLARQGDPLPWTKAADRFRLREGEVTVWAGVNYSGKTQLTSQVMLWVSRHSPVFLASLEMPLAATLRRLARQAAGSETPSREWVSRFLDKVRDKVWLYGQTKTVSSMDQLFGACAYAVTEKFCRHVVIDNLAMCVSGTDDYTGQKNVVMRAMALAQATKAHVHIVHHIRKGQNIHAVPDRWDLKGAGEIADLADNVAIVHRNRLKEERSGTPEYNAEEYDAILKIDKQRHGEWDGSIFLWYHEPSGQYVSRYGCGAMPWPSPEEQPYFMK